MNIKQIVSLLPHFSTIEVALRLTDKGLLPVCAVEALLEDEAVDYVATFLSFHVLFWGFPIKMLGKPKEFTASKFNA